jgi:hypothetical protein
MTLDKKITTQELMDIDYRYSYTSVELLADWEKLKKVTTFKKGSQFKPGMKMCQHFCDNFWNIKNEDGKSFADCWKDPVLMDKVRLWGLSGMSQLWLSWIRRAVFMSGGLPNSSFYRPHFTKQVTMMTGKKTGVLFDPCAGWGGRMLGTVANDWKYVSCEPNKETFDNLNRMSQFLQITNEVSLHNTPAELFDIESLSVDVVLTSPPYFNLEIYNDDPNQSYNQFNTYDLWRDKWLVPLIERCLSVLKDDGISAWNVMNFKKHDLTGDVIRTHEKHGWFLDTTVGFDSPLANIRKLKNKDVTYVFRKR